MRMSNRLLVLAAALQGGACAAGPAAEHTAVQRDSAGIAIIENRGPLPPWGTAEAPVLRIGVPEGQPAYQFHRVQYAARLPDGGVVVADGGSLEVRWFDAAGRHVASGGRPGAGPGEFRAFSSVLLNRGDTLAVYDPVNQRVTWLVRGASVGQVPLRTGARTELLQAAAADRLLVAQDGWADDLVADYSYRRDPVHLAVLSETGESIVASIPGTETAIWAHFPERGPARMMFMGLPFARPLLTAATGEGGFLLGAGERHQLEWLDPAGTLVRIARHDAWSARPADAALVQHYLHHQVDGARERGHDAAAAERNARSLLALLPPDHTVPSFDRLLVASDERIWVRDFVAPWARAETQSWTVFEPDGIAIARAVLPAGFDVMHIARDHVTGVTRDGLDVEYVTVLRLAP